MSHSCDVILNQKFKIHIAMMPDINLVVISDLEDFGEYWLSVDVIRKTKYEMHFDIRTLAGVLMDAPIQAAARYLIELIHRARPTLLKFILNINLSREIAVDRSNVMMLGEALHDLIHLKCPSAGEQICTLSTSSSQD